MDKLIEAYNVELHYNTMPLNDFIDEYEKWSGETVSEEEREQWRFTGLNNIDFLHNRM